MKFVFYLFIFCLFPSCVIYREDVAVKNVKIDNISQLLETIGIRVAIEYGFQMGASGVFGMNQIDSVMLIFKSRSNPIHVEEARRLILSINKEILDFLNRNKLQNWEYVNFPMTEKNISVGIIFEKGEFYEEPPFVSTVSQDFGELEFEFFAPKSRRKMSKIIETYEEAVEKSNATDAVLNSE